MTKSRSRRPKHIVSAPRDKQGVALLIALAVLVLMALLAVSFYRSQDIESKAASTGANSRRAESVAQGGSEWAIALLEMDTGDVNDNRTLAYDTNFDIWGPRAHETSMSYANNSDLLFYGTDVDPFDLIGNDDPVCAWKTVSDGRRITARIVVYIEDENGKANLCVAGNEDGAQAEGVSPAEIDLGEILSQIDSSWGTTQADQIIAARFGLDGKPGDSGVDDDGDAGIGFPGCDDDLDGTIDNPGEATDEPDEYSYSVPNGDDIRLLDFTTALMDAANIRDLKTSNDPNDNDLYRLLRRRTTVHSWTQSVYKLHPGEDDGPDEWQYQVDVNTASVTEIRDALQALQDAGRLPVDGPSDEPIDLDQVAVNIFDFHDEGNEPSEFNGKYGIERTPYINEVEASPVPVPYGDNAQMTEWGEYIELINPYDEAMQVTLVGVHTLGGTGRNITLTVPAADGDEPGYAIVADRSGILLTTNPDTGVTLQERVTNLDPKAGRRGGRFTVATDIDLSDKGELKLALGAGTSPVIQVSKYPSVGIESDVTAQKNDPRVESEDNWEGLGGTLKQENANWDPGGSGDQDSGADLDELFVVYDGPIGSVGHLGHVHIGQPWATIDLTGDEFGTPADWEALPETESWLNIYDAFTTSSPNFGRYGLININTASEEVLSGLKGVDAAAVANDTESGVVFRFRGIGQMANPAYLTVSGSGTSWEKEKALADIANLITVRSNTFRVIVVAQAVARSGETARVAERRLEAIVRRYVDTSSGKAYVSVLSTRWLTED